MASYRDPLKELLSLRERAEEGLYYGRRDEELIARLRAKRRELEERRAIEAARMRCPECGARLREVIRRGIRTAVCPHAHGLWIPPGALETIIERERDSWFERYVHLRW